MAPPRRPPLRPTTIRTTTEKPGPSPAFLLPYNPELPFMEVGKIKQVPLREIWKREDSDFTVWLEKNIDYLNDVLYFEVTIEEREKSVGSFSLDLYGDDGMGGKVIIENQLEKTDHDHLGKVLTYLTNLDAHRAIWISPQPRDEHGRAIDWLNEYTPDDIAFYLVKLDAIRIGNHPVAAPQFTVVKGPSEQIKQIGQEKKDSAARDSIRREFWTQFLERMSDVGGAFGSGEPSRHDYLSRGLGMTGLHQTVYCTGSYVRTEIYMSKNTAEDNKRKEVEEVVLHHDSCLNRQHGRARSCCVRVGSERLLHLMPRCFLMAS